MFRKRMLQAVPRATVVLTNPTHYAVALEYNREKSAAPIVVAKGGDLIAAKIREIAREHWDYGRWAAATQGLGWLPRHIYYVLLPACRELAQSASLRAMMNLTLPLTQASTALAVILRADGQLDSNRMV